MAQEGDTWPIGVLFPEAQRASSPHGAGLLVSSFQFAWAVGERERESCFPSPSIRQAELGCTYSLCVASEALTFQRGGEENGTEMRRWRGPQTPKRQHHLLLPSGLGGVLHLDDTAPRDPGEQSSTHANHKVVRSFRGTVVVVAVPFLLLLLSSINFPTELGNGCIQFLFFS